MAAYLILRVQVHDMDGYSGYTALTPAIIEAHGGRFLSRGQSPVTLEGPIETRRMVLLEFPDVAHAQAFYASSEYQAAKALREPFSDAELLVLPGVSA
ncbi:DUF1330 domain-containing protein [Burkholderia multivorans]|uniref:DUF1330 domain-containing protein n=1 Tax=Burkholderia multivorans TaxID=87883 RepID=UPI001C24DF16|nr:DUF1330 domain-containing protein [Burkholderia multivorans]MBU9480909.1 DUF1330 domain-containing protein [Burkholderia multivorans]